MRFARNSSSKENRQVGQLEAVEYAAAEQYWIKQAQGQAFSREIQLLSSNQDIEPASPLSDLHPSLDHDNTLKVTGRLQQYNAPCSVTQPIILPNDHRPTELIIMDAHYQVGHEGVSSTMTTLRQRFWIPRARQVIKKTIRNCLLCSRFRTKPTLVPFAPLPAERVNATKPFEISGTDFAGPLFVKAASAGTSSSKTYIVLFTCATTRAVHLELSSDLSTEAFLLAFRRFISRRGIPSTIYSDNATSFKRASADLRVICNSLSHPDLSSHLAERRIRWKFIV